MMMTMVMMPLCLRTNFKKTFGCQINGFEKSTTLTHRKQNLFWYATKYQVIMHFTTLYLQSKPSYHQNWISTGWWRWSNKVIKHQPSRQTALLQSYPEWMKTKKLLKHCHSTNSLWDNLNGKEDVCVKIKTKELKEITSFPKNSQ